ncbi:cytochrome d ubiquinol oxidase subunit II [Flavobacterium sp. '19STA2R22 D10 B1']|uniref:cytochrome d ubiquinol oxidase subunit II n=1 Tax=Flavobacterium aerium TaxID=3037261 RepID=UPI00278C2D1E|nr:cytochrome d ubiquinol oxidase subunit II [Flavobacterium sp. '19STA2R22 D10 B1']
MLYVVLFFAAFSFFLYVILGGADFGAGIIELFSSKQNRIIAKKTTYGAIGPIWEANHIWIIILVVILWIAFPAYYNVLVIYLHIPLTLILLGITLRGVAFVFRHYDAVKDKSQVLYDKMFELASLVTPVFLGMTFGALIGGNITITDDYTHSGFKEIFIDSWLQPFPIFVGFFYAALCAFLAATLLIGEAAEENKKFYMRKAAIAIIVVVIIGFITLAIGYYSGNRFVQDFIVNKYAIISVILSGVLLIPLRQSILKGRMIWCRALAGIQVILIIVAAIGAHFPNIIITENEKLNIFDGIAPESVINVLGISLLIGGFVILPGLFHLLKSFKMIKILEDRE